MNDRGERRGDELTVEQASDFLGLEPETLVEWTKQGQVSPTSGRTPREWRYAQQELERARRELMYPEVPEQYKGYILRAHYGVSEDGRFGRCWYHVFESDADEREDRRLFSLVMLVHHLYVDRRGRPLDAMALQEARRAIHAMLDNGRWEAGRLYRKTIGRQGVVQDTSEELRASVYE